MGFGMAVPGVSAGTIAIIVGLYDEMIEAFANIGKHFKQSVKTLFPILLGLVIASLLLFVGIHFGYSKAEYVISCIFAGFVIGTTPIIARKVDLKHLSFKTAALIIVGFIIAAGIGVGSALAKLFGDFSISVAFINGTWWTYPLCVVAGFIAMAACVIPGISGSMCLFMFGLYNPILEIIIGENSILHNHDRILSGLALLVCLAIGAVSGLLLASKGMKRAVEKHKDATFALVLGFVLGSIVCLFCNQALLDEADVWAYARTPLWGWILGSILLIGVTVASYFLISKKQLGKIDEK